MEQQQPQNNDQMQSQQILKLLQQKIGNLELTVHAMMNVLEKEELLDQERINEEAQSIVEEMQNISEEDVQQEVEERIKETAAEEENEEEE